MRGAVVPGSAVALEGVTQLSTIEVVIAKVVMPSPNALFDAIHLQNTMIKIYT